MLNYRDLIKENNRRKDKFREPYNQITGLGSVIPRTKVHIEEIGVIYLPNELLNVGWISNLCKIGSISDFIYNYGVDSSVDDIEIELWRKRLKYDFEFFAASCASIQDKASGVDVPFLLNYPQRLLLRELEDMRLSNKPIRLILLKARQWGGSTLTQLYIAWFQLFRKTGWNSVIAAHLKDSSANIKGMYTKVLENLPEWCYDDKPEFKPFERSGSTSIIKSVNCRVTIGSAEAPNSVRGVNIAMTHLSEIAFWKDTKEKLSTDLIRSIVSPILPHPDTIIVLESTANGVGDYFHTEYLSAKQGNSDKRALFIPWYFIELYQQSVDNYDEVVNNFSEYDEYLWREGATLEAICWHQHKRKEYHNLSDMQAEYPTDDIEAFALSGENVFKREWLQYLRETCTIPLYIGEISSLTGKYKGVESLQQLIIDQKPHGELKIWREPQSTPVVTNDRYIVSVDVGGRSKSSDYSVISVIDRLPVLNGGGVEVVAQWRGHCDHDILIWRAAQIATYYNNALLVIESNTLETNRRNGDNTQYLLEEIAEYYPNLYSRESPAEDMRERPIFKWGFHTNRATKHSIVSLMIAILRDNPYTERDNEAVNEYEVYVKDNKGAYNAIEGHHDDIIMSRMIGNYVAHSLELPKIQDTTPVRKKRKLSSAASFN